MSSRKQSIKFLIFLICTALLFISVLIFCAKGIKNEQDVINDKKQFQSKKINKQLIDYDWLNERDS